MSDQIFTASEEGEKLVINSYQDVEPHLKAAHAERLTHSSFEKKSHNMRKVMTVPFNVIQKICNDTGLDFFDRNDAKRILEILKSPEYKGFRTVNDKRL